MFSAAPSQISPTVLQAVCQLYKRANEQTSKGDDKVYNVPGVSVQFRIPVKSRRELTEEERLRIRRAQERWIPDIIQHYGTPVPNLMSSPSRGALLAGLLGLLGGGGIGFLLDRAFPKTPIPFWLLGALLGSGVLGFKEYFSRAARNASLEDLMQRLPEGATLRDLRSDPVFSEDYSAKRPFYSAWDVLQYNDYSDPKGMASEVSSTASALKALQALNVPKIPTAAE